MYLLLFTASHPYDSRAEQTFLNVELEYLKRGFDQIILVPRNCEGKRLDIPEGIQVDESYCSFLERMNKIRAVVRALSSRLFFQEVFSRPVLMLHPSAIKRLVAFVTGALLTRSWVENWLKQKGTGNGGYLFYTYWLDQAAMGIGLVKQHDPRLRLVSRAHAYDLYEEVSQGFSYWPCRRMTISMLDGLFPDSDAGLAYLRGHYPQFGFCFQTELLGVKDLKIQAKASRDGCLRIVSCSHLARVKRVDLLMRGILRAAALRPGQEFLWTHIGGGKTWMTLKRKAENNFPHNMHARLPGFLSPQDLYAFYRNNPVDVFINVSSREGTPVSIMEAACCGIPIIATSVGGNVEIVTGENGFLLGQDPGPDEIAQVIFKILDHPERTALLRKGSRRIWEKRYNADVNFKVFTEKLKVIKRSDNSRQTHADP